MKKNKENFSPMLINVDKNIKKRLLRLSNSRVENDEPAKYLYEVFNEVLDKGLEHYTPKT